MRDRLFYNPEMNAEDLILLDKYELEIAHKLKEQQRIEYAKDSLAESEEIINPDTSTIYPNEVSYEQLLKAGLPQKVAYNWSKYVESGGKIHTRADLEKIYGMNPDILASIIDRVAFSGRKYVPKKNVRSDINKADTTALKEIRGVGSVLASRIIRFRDALGGFVQPGQLYQVYHLDSPVVRNILSQYYISKDFAPQKLKINSIEADSIAKHPYISYKLANFIVSFRDQKPFQNTYELLKIPGVDSALCEKLEPYFMFE